MKFDSGAWVILNDIEKSIKAKIEAKGTPLKDWDISIYRGILTGCNEAFIISGEKRKELIAKDAKSAEIIRPILRGKDIKRYGYEFADLYIIATFPSRHYNIDHFPAVKHHLENFGKDDVEYLNQYGQDCWGKRRLGQTGLKGARKKTNNQWFETQDSISYWDDFSKPKIVYSEIVREPQFYLDKSDGFFVEATSFLMTGAHLEYLLILLHSKLMTFAFKSFYAGGGLGETGYRYKKAFLELLPVIIPSDSQEKMILTSKNPDIEICNIYGLTNEEIAVIENH